MRVTSVARYSDSSIVRQPWPIVVDYDYVTHELRSLCDPIDSRVSTSTGSYRVAQKHSTQCMSRIGVI